MRVFFSKYQEYCKTRDVQYEIFTIVQNDDETLEEYLDIFLYKVKAQILSEYH